ncbi:MAG: diguanylate cyclase [Gallionellaceae bacterium]
MISNAATRILVVDDELTNIEVIADIFGDDHEILFATDGPRALEIALTAKPDVILLDVMMPGMDGHEVCRRLKSQIQTCAIPVIFITALSDVGAETCGLELGAADYVTKPFYPAVVKVRVRNQIELKRAREQLTRLATTDGLTGLANRRCFDEVLEQEYIRHSRSGAELSLILLDIDHFKLFNDAYGHISGDDCLRQVAQVMGGVVVRAVDLAARYGGEEFVCVLPETSLDGAVAVAEKIRESIMSLCIPHRNSNIADIVTASFGVVVAKCVPGKSPLNVVAQADELLYAAKSSGRNRVCAASA